VTAANAKNKYDRAITGINQLEEQRRQAANQLALLRKNQDITEEAKQRHVTELRETVLANYRESRGEIETLLREADAAADKALRGDPTDDALEARKNRAITRVSRLMQSGKAAASAAEIFAEAGDLDALRALRDEIPSIVAAVDTGDRLGTRARGQQIHRLTLTIDTMMAPLLPRAEAEAARLRGNVDTALSWVQSLGEDTVKTLNGSVGVDRSMFYRDMLAEV
jgi:hypothetical protein